ncbi:MAG: hypothetical protein GEV08_22865 [Acidimicrobiia bacterium]|nr:hypothetical protein [Acidimicrobiia bacterium]
MRRPPPPPPPRPSPAYRQATAALGVFVVVLLSLQVFLLTVGVDALLADDDRLAWVTAGFSALLAAGAAAFYRYLR